MGLTRAELQGHLAMFLFSAMVAGSFSLGGKVANDLAPAALNAVRFLMASGIVAIVVTVSGGFKRAYFAAPWRFFVLGGMFSCYFVLMFYGLQTATPVNTAAVYTLTPALTALFGFLLLRQGATRVMLAALAIGAMGAVIVIFRADWQALKALDIGRGELIFFFGCVAHAIYTPMVRKLSRGEPAASFTLGMLIAGTIVLSAVGWSDLRSVQWGSLRPMVWIALLYLAVFSSAASFVLLQFAAVRLPSAKVMAYTYLVPSWVILWELGFGQAAPSGLVLVGVALTIVALSMLLKDGTKQRQQAV